MLISAGLSAFHAPARTHTHARIRSHTYAHTHARIRTHAHLHTDEHTWHAHHVRHVQPTTYTHCARQAKLVNTTTVSQGGAGKLYTVATPDDVNMWVLHVYGTPTQMGHAQGQLTTQYKLQAMLMKARGSHLDLIRAPYVSYGLNI